MLRRLHLIYAADTTHFALQHVIMIDLKFPVIPWMSLSVQNREHVHLNLSHAYIV